MNLQTEIWSKVNQGVSEITESEYRSEKNRLGQRLEKISYRSFQKRKSILLVFEGWDAAGKGGAIRRIWNAIDPRLVQIHGISAPTQDELAEHYLSRFWAKIPPRGKHAIFDRSWYGRVLVERVEKFATEAEWNRAYREINWFEQELENSGYLILKFFLHIDSWEQEKRFLARANDPLKRWKLTDEDFRNRSKWTEYETAISEMIQKTSRSTSPWIIIPSNQKYYSRITIMRSICEFWETL
jgi:polyphosphate kinase 2 (PPK2 family)